MAKSVLKNGEIKTNIFKSELIKLNINAENAFLEVIWPELKEKLKSKMKGKTVMTYEQLTAEAEILYGKLSQREKKVVDMFHHLRTQAKLYHSQGRGAGPFATFDTIVNSYYDDVAELEKLMDKVFKKMNMKGTMPHSMEAHNLDIINLEHGGENSISRTQRNKIWKGVKKGIFEDSVKAIIDDIIKSESNIDRSKHYEKLIKALDGRLTRVPYLMKNSIKDGWKPLGGKAFYTMFESMIDVMDSILLKMNGYDLHRVLLDPKVVYKLKKKEVALAIRTSTNVQGSNQYSDAQGTAAQHTVDGDNKRINRPTLKTFIRIFFDSKKIFPEIAVDQVFWRGLMDTTKVRVDFTSVSNKNTHTTTNPRYVGFSMYIESSLNNLEKVTAHSAGFGRNDIFLLTGANGDYMSVVSDKFFNNLEVVAPKDVIERSREFNGQKTNKVIRDVLLETRKNRAELHKLLAQMPTAEDFKSLELMMQGALLYDDYVKKVQLAYSDYSLKATVKMAGKTSEVSTWVKLDLSSIVQEKLKDPKIKAEFMKGKWLEAGTTKSDRVPNLKRLMKINKDGTISISRELLLNTRTMDNAQKASGPTKTSMLGNSFGKMFAVLKITNADVMNISMKFPNGLPINLFFNVVKDTGIGPKGNHPFAFNLTENPALKVAKSIQYQGAIQGDGFVSGNTRHTGTQKTPPIFKVIYGENITSLPYWMIFGLRSEGGIFHGQTGGAGSGVFIGKDPKYYSPDVIEWNERIKNSNNVARVYATDFIDLFKKIVRSGGAVTMYNMGSLDNLFVVGGATHKFYKGPEINILQHALSLSSNLSIGDKEILEKLIKDHIEEVDHRSNRKKLAAAIVGLLESDPEYKSLIYRWLDKLPASAEAFTRKTYVVPRNHPLYYHFQKNYDGMSYMLSIIGSGSLGKMISSGVEAHRGYAHVRRLLQDSINFLNQINDDLKDGRMVFGSITRGWNAYVANRPSLFAPMSSPAETATKTLAMMSRYLDILPADLALKMQKAGIIELAPVKGSDKKEFRLAFRRRTLHSGSDGLAALEILIGFMKEIQISYINKLRDMGKTIDLISAERGIPNRGSQLSVEVLYKSRTYIMSVGAIETVFKYVPGAPGNYIDVLKSKKPYIMAAKALRGSSPIFLLIAAGISGAASGADNDDYQEEILSMLISSFSDRNGYIDTAKIEGLSNADLTYDEIRMKDSLLIYNKNTNGAWMEWAKDPNDQKKLYTYMNNLFYNAFGAGTDEHFGKYGDPLMQSAIGPILQEINKWMIKYLEFDLVDMGLFALLMVFGIMIAAVFIYLASISAIILVIIIILLLADISDGEWDGLMTALGYFTYLDGPWLALNHLLSRTGNTDFFNKLTKYDINATDLGYNLEFGIPEGGLLQKMDKSAYDRIKREWEKKTGKKLSDDWYNEGLPIFVK